MNETKFAMFLKNAGTIKTEKARKSRIAKAKAAEQYLRRNLDIVVSNDMSMFKALVKLENFDNPNHAPHQNAVRWYYKMVNKKEFPRKRAYAKQNGIKYP